jgi:hypothetical protein
MRYLKINEKITAEAQGRKDFLKRKIKQKTFAA